MLSGWCPICYMAKDALVLLVVLPLPPQCWDDRCVPQQANVVLGTKPGHFTKGCVHSPGCAVTSPV